MCNRTFLGASMVILIGLAAPISQSSAETFSYNRFQSTTGLVLKGAASPMNDGRLRVTPAIPGKGLGAVWRETKQPVQDGFDTTFQIQITDKYCFGADGMAFVIQNGDAPPEPRVAGHNIGYGDWTNLLVVKFDDYHWRQQVFAKFDEIAVLAPPSPETPLWDSPATTLASVTNRVVFSDGAVHLARIKYVPGNLQVYLDDLENPLMTVYLNLARMLALDNGRAWVGFVAASGADWQNQDLVSWSFASDDVVSRLKRAMARLNSNDSTLNRGTTGRPLITASTAEGADPLFGSRAASSAESTGDSRGGFAPTDPDLNRTNVLHISAFENGGATVTQLRVSESGFESRERITRGAVQGIDSRQLTAPQMSSIRAALDELPRGTDILTLDGLVIVGFRNGTNWVARVYHSATLPEGVRKIYAVIWRTGDQAVSYE